MFDNIETINSLDKENSSYQSSNPFKLSSRNITGPFKNITNERPNILYSQKSVETNLSGKAEVNKV